MLDAISLRRQILCENYLRLLKPLETMGLLSLPKVPDSCRSNYHMFYVLFQDMQTRDAMIANLKQDGIGAAFHYVPLHLSPMGEKFGYAPGDLPVTENLAGRLLRLPLHCDLSQEDQCDVVTNVTRFLAGASTRRMAA